MKLPKDALASPLAAISAALIAGAAFGVVELPEGYAVRKFVTIPNTGRSSHNGVVTEICWKDAARVYVKYALTETGNFMLLGSVNSVEDCSGCGGSFVALQNGSVSKGDTGSRFSGVNGSLAPADRTSYCRDGTARWLAVNVNANSVTQMLLFGCGWSDTSWNRTADWYAVRVYGADGTKLADFVPCVRTEDGEVGFYDLVRDKFYGRGISTGAVFAATDFAPGEETDACDVWVEGFPSRFGTASPDYGVSSLLKSVTTFAIDYALTTYDDGVEAIDVADGIRAQFGGVAVQGGSGAPVTNEATSVDVDLACDRLDATWLLKDVQYRVVAGVLDAETVRVNGETSCENWLTRGGSVTLTATSTIGAQFETWLGDTDGIENITSATISVPADRPRSLTAKFGVILVGWSYDPASQTIADGNWRINVTEVADGLSIASIVKGEGVLDLTNFESESRCGKKVTAIGSARLGGYERITAFIGPDVVRLGSQAFCFWGGTNYGKITRIVLSDAVSQLDNFALNNQTGLTDLSPMTFTNVTQFGERLFENCTALAGCLSFPNLTEDLGSRSFSGCSALQEVRLPKRRRISVYEFLNCSALTNVVVSPEIESIGYGAFRGCSKLTCLTPTTFAAVTSCGELSNYGIFQGCSALNLPLAFPKLEVVPQQMFQGCSALMSVSLSAATNVHQDAFNGIASGSTIRFGRTAPTFGANAVASTGEPFPRIVAHGASTEAGWRALTEPNAETFAEYRTTKADYPGSLACGLCDLGGWSWVIDDAPGFMLLVR